MPDKEDLLKKITIINRKIRDIMESLSLLNGKRPQTDDGMFTKKPYGPGACAACDKDLINIQGQPVDYHVWNKLPFRDPGERIAKYGQGFSKILNNMKPGRDDGMLLETSIDVYNNNSRSTAHDTDTLGGAHGSHGYSTHQRHARDNRTANITHRVVSTTRNSKPNSQFASPHKFGHNANASVDDSLLQHPGTIP